MGGTQVPPAPFSAQPMIPVKLARACLVALGLAGSAHAADITVSANWARTVNRDNLAAGAGTDLASSFESAAPIATLDVTNTAGASWTVTVAKSNVTWPANVAVAVKRNSDGAGTGSIASGTTYVAVDGTARTFFTGTGDRTGVQIQLKVDGLAVKALPALYSLVITYTVQ
jgi:hypothetical protein